jgi:hypothetical protein
MYQDPARGDLRGSLAGVAHPARIFDLPGRTAGMVDDPADRMRERSQRSTLSLYLLLDADRRLLAAGIVAFVSLGLVGASLVLPGTAAALHSGDPVETAFQALVGAIVTGCTLSIGPFIL